MNRLLDIQPSRELKFVFEVKKQNTCNVQLINKTDHHVAFKVKTTSPKKYCVRPNVGLVLPKETCEFIVIMQAQRSPPPDVVCKDKFLIQSTIVPAGTMEDDITSDMFSKVDGKYIEERKLKVILVSPPHSPELSPMNGKIKQVPSVESSVVADELLDRTERHSPHHMQVPPGESSVVADELLNRTERRSSNHVVPPVESSVVADELLNRMERRSSHRVSWNHQDVEDAKEISKEEVHKPMTDASFKADKNVEAGSTEAEEPVVMRDMESQSMFSSAKNGEIHSPQYVHQDVEEDATELNILKNEVEKSSTDTRFEEVKNAKAELTKAVEPVITRHVDTQPIEVVESNSMEDLEVRPVKGMEPRMVKEADNLRLAKDVEEMKSKLLELEAKLGQAEKMILKVMEDRRSTIQERQLLEQQLALLRTERVQKTVHEGFPLLFVCMVALMSIVIGYLFRR